MLSDSLSHLSLACSSGLLTLLAALLARHAGFFSLTKPKQPVDYDKAPYLYLTMLLAFACFMLMQALVAPFLVWSILCRAATSCTLTAQQEGWITAVTICAIATCVINLSLIKNKDLRHVIWGDFSYRYLLIGIAAWLIGYPAMVASGQFMLSLISLIGSSTSIEQVAVQELRRIQAYPWLLKAMAFIVTVVVPITEEILFRGLLQNTLRCFFTRFWSITGSAAIFAFFHFSAAQGLNNLDLMASLFTLACLLGFLYERYHSLWTCIALHATFNTVSMVTILLSS